MLFSIPFAAVYFGFFGLSRPHGRDEFDDGVIFGVFDDEGLHFADKGDLDILAPEGFDGIGDEGGIEGDFDGIAIESKGAQFLRSETGLLIGGRDFHCFFTHRELDDRHGVLRENRDAVDRGKKLLRVNLQEVIERSRDDGTRNRVVFADETAGNDRVREAERDLIG